VLRTLFGIGGFLLGLGLGAHLFTNNTLAVVITAAICAWLAAALYKVLLGLVLAAIVAAAFINAASHTTSETSPPPNQADIR
jgi:hypothetical protein